MKRPTTQFALCLDNAGNEASLIRGKVYGALPDARAAKDNLVRVARHLLKAPLAAERGR